MLYFIILQLIFNAQHNLIIFQRIYYLMNHKQLLTFDKHNYSKFKCHLLNYNIKLFTKEHIHFLYNRND